MATTPGREFSAKHSRQRDESGLVVSELSAGYGDKAVIHGLSLIVPDAAVVAVIGPNGAGKSTTLKAIYGALSLRSGQINFEGESIARCGPKQNIELGLGYVPQGGRVFPDLSVSENLDVAGRSIDRDAELERRRRKMYQLFPILNERRGQRARSLSGGEKQMLAIAMGLMPAPRLLMVDEPSIGLAPALMRRAFDKLAAINSDDGTSILLVEQNVERAIAISDHIYVLQGGRFVLSCPVEDFDSSMYMDLITGS